MTMPYATVIIPCRNEVRFIAKCLDSMLANDYPREKVEILVLDGISDDGTRAVLHDYERRHEAVRVLDNPKKTIPAAMNLGILSARGSVIMKVDAHSEYPPNYISECVRNLIAYNAANAGGVVRAVPRDDTVFGQAVVTALSSRFGVGNSRFRTASDKPEWADTAYSGCYRKEWLLKVGLYDEELPLSEDIDLNSRLRAAGGRTLLLPHVVVNYYARSRFGQFWKHNVRNGYWVTYPLLVRRTRFSARHFVPALFVGALLMFSVLALLDTRFLIGVGGLTGLYAACAVTAAGAAADGVASWLALVAAYAALHIGYGAGSLAGAGRGLTALLRSRRQPEAAC